MIGVLNGVLFMICWAISTVSLVLLGCPIILAIFIGLVLSILGVMVIDTDWDAWF